MEKFFDKESLLDIMYTLCTKAGIDEKDYRMWYKLNEDTEIAVKTCVGESKTEVVKKSVEQAGLSRATLEIPSGFSSISHIISVIEGPLKVIFH